MNNNKFDADKLYDVLMNIQYCEQGRDLQQEQDVLAAFKSIGFEEIDIDPKFKTKEQKDLIDNGKGVLSKLSRAYKQGLYISHHPYGKNRYPDFFVIIYGQIIEFEVKTSSTDVPIFSQGDKIVDPTRRDAIYLFTHKTDGTAMLMAEDLITPENYSLIMKQKQERLSLQEKHDREFEDVCGGQGEKIYHRVNIAPRGGQDITNHISRARENDLSQKIWYLLKTYEYKCTLSKV